MENFEDILVFLNFEDENMLKIKIVLVCQGRCIVENYCRKVKEQEGIKNYFFMFVIFMVILVIIMELMVIIFLMGMFVVFFSMMVFFNMCFRNMVFVLKLFVDNCGRKKVFFVDVIGVYVGVLFGDVRYDFFQSGGLGMFVYECVELGMIYCVYKGVLFIDEIVMFLFKMQQSFFMVMQEKKFLIIGQSEMLSGVMVRMEFVLCDFILVVVGNLDIIDKMYLVLCFCIRGYGYEVYMRIMMLDIIENRRKFVQFVVQEVKRDGKILYFIREVVEEIVREVQKRVGRKGYFMFCFRDFGGIVRVVGDIVIKKGKKYVEREDVFEVMRMVKLLEKQFVDWYIENKKEYQVIKIEGGEIGRVNGFVVIGEQSGIVLLIEVVVVFVVSKEEGKIIVIGKFGEIVKEVVQNVLVIIKCYKGEDISRYDIYVQFFQIYEGVEGDLVSISVVMVVILVFENILIRQDVVMIGFFSVCGEVFLIGGVILKIEVVIEVGIKKVIIFKVNEKDVFLSFDKVEKIEIYLVEIIDQVLEIVFQDGLEKDEFFRRICEVFLFYGFF